MDKQKLARILACVVLAAGIACVVYPVASDFFYKQAQKEASIEYNDSVEKAPKENLKKEWQEARRYNSDLLKFKAVVTDPFDPKLKKTTSLEYSELLDVSGSGVMCTVKVPSAGIDTPVLHGVDEEALAKGAGHLEGTSLPVGGKSTHCVIAGHTGLSSVRVFDSLELVKKGDLMVLEVLDEAHAYRVVSTEVVLPEETDSLLIEKGKDLLTLVTCTPYGINTHRLLVRGERCPLPDDWGKQEEAKNSVISVDPADSGALTWSVIGLLAGAVVCLLAVAAHRVRSKRRADASGGQAADGEAKDGGDKATDGEGVVGVDIQAGNAVGLDADSAADCAAGEQCEVAASNSGAGKARGGDEC